MGIGTLALMTNDSHLHVSNPPPNPLMIWDGECHFCKRWIERWREITAGKVDYATYQEAAARFPEIPVEQFQRAVAFIEPNGEAFFAAEAVYRSLAISILKEMAGVELRSRSWFRRHLRDRLQIHRATSQSRIDLYSIVVGQRRATADLFLGASLVSPHAWTHLSDRIRVALGASGWTCWE